MYTLIVRAERGREECEMSTHKSKNWSKWRLQKSEHPLGYIKHVFTDNILR